MTSTLLDSPLIAKLALEWLRAEHAARVAETGENFVPSEDELAIAQDRVFQVCMGEVRWSECGPGDKAIWKGRMRDVERFEQMWRTSPRLVKNRDELDAADEREEARRRLNYPGPQGRGVRTPFDQALEDQSRSRRRVVRRHAVWYDTVGFQRTGNRISTRLFGNENIGNFFLTNLQVPGRLASDQTAIILSFSVSVSSMAALRWAADHVAITFIMGEMPNGPGPMFVRDLFMGIPLLQPITVPVRQTVSAQVNVCGLTADAGLPDGIDPFTLTFHMEGLSTWDIQ